MNYCPLARGRLFAQGKYPIFDDLQKRLSKTKAQLFLKWAMQSGFVTIPKSSNSTRIKENSELFGWFIDDKDMAAIDELEDGVEVSFATSVMREPWNSLEK